MALVIRYFVRSKAFQSIGNRPDLFPLFYPNTVQESVVLNPDDTVMLRARIAHALWIIFLTETTTETTTDLVQATKLLLLGNQTPHTLFIGSPLINDTVVKTFNALVPADFKAPTQLANRVRSKYPTHSETRLADAIYFVALGSYSTPSAPKKKTLPSSSRYNEPLEAAPKTSTFATLGTRLSIQVKSVLSKDTPEGIDPHVYLYLCGDAAGSLSSRYELSSPDAAKDSSTLKTMYRGARGYMWRLADNPTLDISFIGAGDHIAAVVFEQIPNTIAPVYQIVSRGFAKRDGVFSLTTFAGPTSSRFKFNPDFSTSIDFDYIPHYQLHTSEGIVAEKRPQSIASNPHAQIKLNAAIEMLYGPLNAAGINENESFIYRGLTSMVPILIHGYLEPDAIPERIFAQMLDRLYLRRGMTSSEFIAALAKDAADQNLRKILFVEATSVLNTMLYVPDQIFGRPSDIHDNVRLTNSGDCEDFAEGSVRILKHMQRTPLSSIKRADVRALYEYVQNTAAECMLIHMRVSYKGNRSSHAVSAAVVPRDNSGFKLYPDPGHQLLCLDATAAENFDFTSNASKFFKELEQIAKEDGRGSLDYFKQEGQERAVKDDFYIGFIGAVLCPRTGPPSYRFFVDAHSETEVASGNGKAVVDVIVEGKYVLSNPLKKELDNELDAELKRIATFVPPLPLGGANESDGVFPKEYLEWLDKMEKAAGSKLTKDRTVRSGESWFPVYINLAAVELKFQVAMETVEKMAGLESVGAVIVQGYSTFVGTAIIEVLFKENKN